jgi:hypothetical protein
LYDSVPTSLGNEVSGFHHLNDKEREEYGFFLVTQPDKSDYDPQFHDVTKEEHELVKGKPVYKFEYVAKYKEEVALELKREKFFNDVKMHRNQLLSSSDWTMMKDVIDAKDEAWVTAWSAYRQALRDITSDEKLFDECNGVFSIDIFPKQPEL